MALHPDFPTSPYEILPPDLRWFPAAEELRSTAYEKLLPPLVAKVREEVARGVPPEAVELVARSGASGEGARHAVCVGRGREPGDGAQRSRGACGNAGDEPRGGTAAAD